MTAGGRDGAADPASLLAAGRALVDLPAPDTVGLWPRAAALLVRQALEAALAEHWRHRAPGLERASMRAQLACLPDYLPDRRLAADVAFTWATLSAVCHHHAYELGPTAAELSARLAVVERLIDRVRRTTPAAGGP
jgi:hypothetical protein